MEEPTTNDDYEGDLPDGHHVFRTATFKNWVMARAVVADSGEGESALNWYQEGFRIYPLAAGRDPDAAYAWRLDGVRVYPDRTYEYLFLGGRHDFKAGDALWLDARLLFHDEAIVVTPAMAIEMVGAGSQYLACYRDTNNKFLMGEHAYRLHLPTGIPAANFWSVTAYHPETRSLLANGEDKPSRNSYDDLRSNEDGSIDIYFGPTPPEGYEQNWIKTLPQQGWQILLRFYGPLETYFDRTWKPDDIVRTD